MNDKALQAMLINTGKGTYSSIVADELSIMHHSIKSSSISELAKLILRESDIEILIKYENGVDEDLVGKINSVILEVEDSCPTLMASIRKEASETASVSFFSGENEIAYVGLLEPESIDIIWIPFEFFEVISLFRDRLLSLAEAGYPGCEGCLEEDMKSPWNEIEHRRQIRNGSR